MLKYISETTAINNKGTIDILQVSHKSRVSHVYILNIAAQLQVHYNREIGPSVFELVPKFVLVQMTET